MDALEAKLWATKLAAAYPTPIVADGTIEWWTEAFEARDRETVMAALKKITREYTKYAPTAGQVAEVLREVAGSHPDVMPALPGETYQPMTAEQEQQVKDLLGEWWGNHGGELERLKAARGRRNLKPDEELRLRQLLAEQALRPTVKPAPPNIADLQARAMDTCPGVGGPVKWRGGHMACAHCGDDMDPDCMVANRDRKCPGAFANGGHGA
jgi:hypothetical protein